MLNAECRMIFVSHSALCILHYAFPNAGMGIKNPHPPNESGVGYKCIPRFHPGYGKKAVTHWRFNGRTRLTISGQRLRSGIRRVPNAEPLHHVGSSLSIIRRGVSSSLPCTLLT